MREREKKTKRRGQREYRSHSRYGQERPKEVGPRREDGARCLVRTYVHLINVCTTLF